MPTTTRTIVKFPPLKFRKASVEVFKLRISVLQSDINDVDACLHPTRCMTRVATERAMRAFDRSEYNHHSKVDAGHISTNIGGYRWHADTPRMVASNIKKWDDELLDRLAAKKAGVRFFSKVKPFEFTVTFRRGKKIWSPTRERQDTINAARRERKAAGHPDKAYPNYRKRIAGFVTASSAP